ncbi:hypothetical protein CVT25_013466 [Psilocybe cyanescens]|uniref:Uncharacterized protein n=1 Tax=Psilocybe cyanescens TaxID=93625 RepID=A0A409WTR6_PSICY|nr:hypothetical protein CVT25_013466 [Psilocybe cyanescens]
MYGLLSFLIPRDRLSYGILGALLLYVFMKQKSRLHLTFKKNGTLDPDPIPNFDLNTARTRNHLYVNKTVRFPYHQTMAHQPMHINDWIEIDSDYTWYIHEKTRVINEQGGSKFPYKKLSSLIASQHSGKHVIDSLPENDDACNELLELLVNWLPKRYPKMFTRLGEDGIWNKVTNERFEKTRDVYSVQALRIISRLVQDDFLMAKEREDGHIYFVGGLVAFPGFYLLSEKINMSLKQAHEPVPYFNEKLLKSVERTLKRFGPHEPFERTSWEIPNLQRTVRSPRNYTRKIFSFASIIKHLENFLGATE